MDSKLRARFGELVVVIIVVAVALIWAERLAWGHITALREQNHAFVEQIGNEDPLAAERFLATANASLQQLQRFLLLGLISLLVSGAVILVLAYRRMIAPLRTTLTESRVIIER